MSTSLVQAFVIPSTSSVLKASGAKKRPSSSTEEDLQPRRDILKCHPQAPDLSSCVVGAGVVSHPGQTLVSHAAFDFTKTLLAHEFVPVPSPASLVSQGMTNVWYQSEEWRGHALFWQEQAVVKGEQVKALELKVDQLKQQMTGVSQQLSFCSEVLQTHSDRYKKEVAGLQDTIMVIRNENIRLASLLSESLTKSQVYDKLKFDYERAREENKEMKSLVESMSATLSCYFEATGDSSDRAQQFSAGFFASPPCDGEGE